MKNIEFLGDFEIGSMNATEKDKEVNIIFIGAHRQIISIKLSNGAVLSKHKANEPITVFCLAGKGTFNAGNDLEEVQEIHTGTLITLESGINHGVFATPELHILVTKFL